MLFSVNTNFLVGYTRFFLQAQSQAISSLISQHQVSCILFSNHTKSMLLQTYPILKAVCSCKFLSSAGEEEEGVKSVLHCFLPCSHLPCPLLFRSIVTPSARPSIKEKNILTRAKMVRLYSRLLQERYCNRRERLGSTLNTTRTSGDYS